MLKVKQMQKRIEELRALVVSLDRQIDDALDRNDEAEADRLEADAKRLVDEESDLQHILYYVRISKQPNNKWFSQFAKSFKPSQYITTGQRNIFDRYGKDVNGSLNAIVDGAVYSAAGNHIYITYLPEIWKEYA